MNRINGFYIGTNYVLVPSGRRIEETLNDNILFEDGSLINLSTGIIRDEDPDSKHKLSILPLKQGVNTFVSGVPNSNPKERIWRSQNLLLNYTAGKVVIRPSTDGTIKVSENKFCIAEYTDGQVRIIPNDYKELSFTYLSGDSFNMSNMGESDDSSTLYISAPVDCQVTGKSKVVEFSSVGSFNVIASKITGGYVATLLKVYSDSSLTIGIKSAKTVSLTSDSSIVAEFLEFVETLVLNSKSSSTLACEKATVINIQGESSCKATIGHADKVEVSVNSSITLNATFITLLNANSNESSINITGKIVEYIFASASSSVTINLDNTKELYIKSGSSVKIAVENGVQRAEIYADSSVTLQLSTATQVTIESGSSVKVSARKYMNKPNIKSDSSQKVVMR